MLHDVWPARCYCGPAAIAAVTGVTAIPTAREWINEARGRRLNQGVTGTSNWELVSALESNGYWPKPVVILPEVKTLTHFAEMHPKGLYIVNVTGHYVALERGTVVDNHMRFGVDVSEHHSRRKWVKAGWRIERLGVNALDVARGKG